MDDGKTRSRSGLDVLCAALALTLLVLLAGFSAWLWRDGHRPLLLVPAIGGLNDCLELEAAAMPPEAACTGPRGSAAARVQAALDALGPRRSADGRFEVGYTLVVPLLNLFQPHTGNTWTIDDEAVQRIARTVRDVDRPVVLYLFSTHFSERAPIEPVLAQDPANLAETPHGPLPVQSFMGGAAYPWSIARLDNAVTQRREQAMQAVTDAICQLPPAVRQRIVGVNLLGEVHHLYPDFEAGMGFDRPYEVTDYSDASRRGFRAWLRQRFGSVAALNAALGSDFAAFEQVEPPSKDIRRERLDNYWQHIDAEAAGTLVINGWVHDAAQTGNAPSWVRIYVDGVLAGRVQARFVRQDVAQARPEFGTGNVGWRHDLHYAALPLGVHRIDVALERLGAPLAQLGVRHFAVMDRRQSAPATLPLRRPLPPMAPPDAAVAFSIDAPADGMALFYNPLVPLWHDFRGQQVVDYIAHFDRLIDGTCLAGVPHRTQQIAPAEGAGWDASRFAAGQSLLPFGHVQLGINLYGEAAEGTTFFDWLAQSRQSGYSVTEFHPLRALNTDQLDQVLQAHRAHGVRTLSFFLHPQRMPPGTGNAPLNPFALDADNPQHGSDRLYQSLRELLRR